MDRGRLKDNRRRRNNRRRQLMGKLTAAENLSDGNTNHWRNETEKQNHAKNQGMGPEPLTASSGWKISEGENT